MAMVVKNNMSAISTLNTLNGNTTALQRSLAKVSSGMKINTAQDDASGYAISERMRVMISGLDQANQNTQNGSSLMKVAEGAVARTVDILKTLKKKAIDAATDTNTDDDRKTIQKEIDQYIDQIDDNALATFNGKYLLDGSKSLTGIATRSAMTNQALSEEVFGGTRLIDLMNRKGETLPIGSTDKVTASYVMNGVTYTTVYNVGNSTLEDIFYNLNDLSVSKGNGRIFGAAYLSEKIDSSDITTATLTTKELYAALQANGKDQYSTTFKTVAAFMAGEKVGDSSLVVAAGTYDSSSHVFSNTTGDASKFLTVDGDTTDIALMSAVLDAIDTEFDYSFGSATGSTSSVSASDVVLDMVFYNADGGTETRTYNLGHLGTAQAFSDAGDAYATFKHDAILSFQNVISHTINAGDDGSVSWKKYGKYLVNSLTGGTTDACSAADIASDMFKASASGDSGTVTLNATGAQDIAFAAGLGVDYNKGTNAYGLNYLVSRLGMVAAGQDVGVNASEKLVQTADNTNGLTITALNSGLSGQIAGVTISIADSEGQTKKIVNEYLDAFTTNIFAKNSSTDNALTFQIGAASNQAITVGLDDMRAESLGLKGSDGTKVSVVSQDKANAAIAAFDNALQHALDVQTTIGAIEARLEYTSSNLTTSSENVQAAESTIRDADMAKEMTDYTKNNVLLQAAQSMLAQANQNSSAVLSLLQ